MIRPETLPSKDDLLQVGMTEAAPGHEEANRASLPSVLPLTGAVIGGVIGGLVGGIFSAPFTFNDVSLTAADAAAAVQREKYVKALELGVVHSAYARVMFLGPGGVGKSSLLKGLMNKSLSVAYSTQLADITAVKPVTKQWLGSCTAERLVWTEVTDDDEIMEIVGYVQLVAKASGNKSSSKYIEMLPQSVSRLQGNAKDQSVEAVQRDIVHKILTRATETSLLDPNIEAKDFEILILSWDCGGQSVFLDILPAFLTPRTVFLTLFDARRKLTDPCLIRSYRGGDMVDEQYHNATTLELLHEWMASIYSMLDTSDTGKISKFPHIIPVGTYGDDDDVKSRKEGIIANLISEVEPKKYAHLVREAVVIDNTTAGAGEKEDPGYDYIRREVHELASKELAVPTPIAWVLFRKVFQEVVKASESPIVSHNLASEIAVACNIPEDSISSMLKFYHDLAVFLYYDQIPSLKDQVIADPQWLVKEIAKILALEGFESVKAPPLWTQLRENGVLLQQLYEEVWKDSKLSPQSLVDLLVFFRIATQIDPRHKVCKYPGKEYYVPCVLPHFRPGIDTSSVLVVSGTAIVKQAAPLHMLFNTHYVPPGFFTRLVVALSTDPKCSILFRHKAYCNRISILYGELDNKIDQITLTKEGFNVQIDLVRIHSRQSDDDFFSSTCREIMKLLQNHALTILNEWFPGVDIRFGFACEGCPGEKDHFIEISPETSTCSQLHCNNLRSCKISIAQQYWLKISALMLSLKGVPRIPSDSELEQVATEIKSKERVQEFVDTLEMNYYAGDEEESDSDICDILMQWRSDMEAKDMHVRSHLVQHLKTIGLTRFAEKTKVAKFLKPSQAEYPEPNESINDRQLITCSKFFTAKELPSLRKVLAITSDEESLIVTSFKEVDHQAYQMLSTWRSKPSNNSRQKLLTLLKSGGLYDAAKNLLKASQIPELSDLLKHVTAAAHWHIIGTHLGLDRHKLQAINKDHPMDCESSLFAMFEAWLDNSDDPSWSMVVKALNDSRLSILASEINDKFVH